MAKNESNTKADAKQAETKKDCLLVAWIKMLLQWNYLGYGKAKDF